MCLPDSFETLGKAPVERRGCCVLTNGSEPLAVVSGRTVIHSCPRALTSHVEWALARLITDLRLPPWSPQPAESGSSRIEFEWVGTYLTASKMTSSLHQIGRIRAEISTHPHDDALGERFLLSPTLGIHRSVIDASGDCVVSEQRVRQMIFECGTALRTKPGLVGRGTQAWEQQIASELDSLFGTTWDHELDVFRSAAFGADIRWLSSAG